MQVLEMEEFRRKRALINVFLKKLYIDQESLKFDDKEKRYTMCDVVIGKTQIDVISWLKDDLDFVKKYPFR